MNLLADYKLNSVFSVKYISTTLTNVNRNQQKLWREGVQCGMADPGADVTLEVWCDNQALG